MHRSQVAWCTEGCLDFVHFSQLDNQSKVVLNSDKKRECAGLCARKRDAGLPTLTLANESNQSFCEKKHHVYIP